jgi:hypothetical protein
MMDKSGVGVDLGILQAVARKKAIVITVINLDIDFGLILCLRVISFFSTEISHDTL